MIRKILIYCYEYPPIGGGAGNALRHLCREWVRSGVECTVITSAFRDAAGESAEEGVRIIRLPVGRAEAGRGRVGEMLRYIWASGSGAQALVERFKPDLVIGFMTLPSGVAPYRLHKKFKLPYVTELRGGDVPGFDPGSLALYHAVTRPYIHAIWRRSALVIANSEGLADLARKSCVRTPVQVVPNGIDTEFFKPDPAVRDVSALHCVYVGRMVESQKRVGLLIRACAQVPSMRLSLVGAGPDEAEYKNMAGALAPGRVTFHGWAGKQELLKVLQSAHVYVSASGWEGMPNAALEAMACGLPLILSKAAGHEELVVDGVNGRLVNSASVDSWVAELKQWEHRQERLAMMGVASRDRALQRHDWAIIARDRLKLYQQALQKAAVH
jgi:glycosyltransferase involved in cell wall biosynthesis